ncbi:MAG: hypothetical protein A2147_06620 [Chloroflexi bacterium RBG_16_57_8]|nr:MAG: hypothetical protein A2147_06620 [Chloroflexi bacterium RBG_16_57_8]
MVVLNKSCPGSRAIREPIPEYMNCSSCGREVEIWTDELKATCPGCGSKVYRAQQASCIDWCPHAKECVGPEVYARLRPGTVEVVPEGDSPADILKRDHDHALEIVGLLHGAGLCLKLAAMTPGTPLEERGTDHLVKVLEFFDRDLRLHFRREEDVLFPALEKHLGQEKSPTRLLLMEHGHIWHNYDLLKEMVEQLRESRNGRLQAVVTEVEETARRMEGLITEHIKKENASLLPLAERLLTGEELEAAAKAIRSLT